MDKESLILARELVIKALSKGKFKNKVDQGELMINLNTYLDENNYDESNKVLRKEFKKGKRK